MAKATANNIANVSSAKGVKGGYIYCAPEGTDIPTDCSKPLTSAFTVLGCISEDGYEESIESDSEDLVDMNGDLMDSPTTSRVESAKVTFAEIKSDVLKILYGDNNVTDSGGMITVKHNSSGSATRVYVLELLLKNNRKWRKVVPLGQSSELDSLKIASSELCARPVTIKYLTDSDGNTCYDYIESTETEASA